MKNGTKLQPLVFAHVSNVNSSLEAFLLFSVNIIGLMWPMCFFLQGCVSGPPQGDPPTICHEKDKSSEPGAEEPDPTGFCGARHPYFC